MQTLKKILNWIKNLLKKTQFDNMLFEQGMKEVQKYLLSLPVEENIAKMYDVIVVALFEKFGHIKCVGKLLNEALFKINEKLDGNTEFIRMAYEDKVKLIINKLIEWYNINL